MKLTLTIFLVCAAAWSFACSPTVTEESARPSTGTILAGHGPHGPKKQKETVLDDQCDVEFQYNASNDLVDIKATPRSAGTRCTVSSAGTTPTIGNLQILDSSGSVTFGPAGPHAAVTGKMICYGPPIPSPPRCVCTGTTCP